MACVIHPAWSRAAVALALAVPTMSAMAQAAPATGAPARPARATTATPVQAPAGPAQVSPATAAAAAAARASQTPPCVEVFTGAQPLVIPIGKATPFRPRLAVTRLIVGNASSGAGIPGGGEAQGGDAAPKAAAPGAGLGPNAGQRLQLDSQPVSARPGVGELDVLLLSPTDVYMTGKSIGSTNLVLIHGGGTCTMLNVVIGMDPGALQAAIQQLLPDEKDVQVGSAFDSLVLKGTVSDAEALNRITDLANAYLRGSEGGGSGGTGGAARNPRIVNMLELGAPQQVMLEVKVAEISKSLLDQFGIDFSRAYVPGDGSMLRFLSGIFGGASAVAGQISGTNRGVPLSSVDAVIGGSVSGVGGNSSTGSSLTGGNVTVTYDQFNRPIYTTSYGTVPGRGVSNINLNMQKTDGLVKVLAEPTVMAISGQTGSFLAGGKIFIPVATTTEGGVRTVSLEEKEFGVSVSFTPTVLGGGRINLRVRPEVSELNTAGVTITGIAGSAVLPSFTSRRAATTVQLMDGQSFAIGGLIKNNTTTNVKAFPFLGEIPVLGTLFRSTEFQTDRSELVFVITPRLVKPLPADYRLPTDNYVPPTRKELILDGKVEGKAPETPPAAAPKAPAGGGFDMQPKEERK